MPNSSARIMSSLGSPALCFCIATGGATMVGGVHSLFRIAIAWSMSGRMPFAPRALWHLGAGFVRWGPDTYVLTAIVHCAKELRVWNIDA